jgi:hypothetical protein
VGIKIVTSIMDICEVDRAAWQRDLNSDQPMQTAVDGRCGYLQSLLLQQSAAGGPSRLVKAEPCLPCRLVSTVRREVAAMRGRGIMRPRSKMLAQDLTTALIKSVGGEPAYCRPPRVLFLLPTRPATPRNGDGRLMLDALHMFQSAALHNAGEWDYSTS